MKQLKVCDLQPLLVEPSPTQQRIILAQMESLGILEFAHASNGAEALDVLANAPIDLVISALYLPDIDKWQAWERDLAEVLAQVDYALIDGTFFGPDELPGRDMSAVPHPFIVETLRQLVEVPEALRRRVFFTHLNHSNPAADPSSSAAEQVRTLGAAVLREAQILAL